ncbi:hypothetical protein [Paenibacillus dendrobii]|uniref:hypothetical protein n=1 Tax=Paenibacillus dendrobii TaxID=2691084 RepID=UPI001371EE3D|nr:hypothetical protein [Paenibacillus dendrobii]
MLGFLKLNYISALYAFVLFAQSELMVNVYRLQRLTGLRDINTWVGLAMLFIFISSTILLYILTKRQLHNRKMKYFTSILWAPYFYLFVYVFASLFPITDPQEEPLGGVGLIIIGMAILFPIYIAIMNYISSIK